MPKIHDPMRDFDTANSTVNDVGRANVLYSPDTLHGSRSINHRTRGRTIISVDRREREGLIQGIVDDFEDAWTELANR